MDAFEDCVVKGRLKKIDADVERVAQELTTAREELEEGLAAFEKGNWAKISVQAYFAMSHCARGALASHGFRDTNFYALCTGIQRLFVEEGVLEKDAIKQLKAAKELKDGVYDHQRVTPHEARRVYGWALEFVKALFQRLALPGFDADELPATMPQAPPPRRRRDEFDEEAVVVGGHLENIEVIDSWIRVLDHLGVSSVSYRRQRGREALAFAPDSPNGSG